MKEVWLGYPGVGLKEYAGYHAEDETVVWQDELDLNVPDSPSGAKIRLMAPYTLEALLSLVGTKHECRVFYPAPEAYREYPARMELEGYSADEIKEFMDHIEADLVELRASTQRRVRHCVLARGEMVLGLV
jgi:hypothetical protein